MNARGGLRVYSRIAPDGGGGGGVGGGGGGGVNRLWAQGVFCVPVHYVNVAVVVVVVVVVRGLGRTNG